MDLLPGNNIEVHWNAIARFNDVFDVNGSACCFRPALQAVLLDDKSLLRVDCEYAVKSSHLPRNCMHNGMRSLGTNGVVFVDFVVPLVICWLTGGEFMETAP
jgi:hypothetical protein